MDFAHGIESIPFEVYAIVESAIGSTILASFWMGRQIKKISSALIDNQIIRSIPIILLKALASLAVIAAHQLLPYTWQIGFWIGGGGFFVLTGAEYKKTSLEPLIYGCAASWLIYAIKGVDIALKTTSLLTTMGAIALVSTSIGSAISWLKWGLDNQ